MQTRDEFGKEETLRRRNIVKGAAEAGKNISFN